jgi:hypothetical protein
MPIHYPGVQYTFSVYSQLASAGSENATPKIVWYNSSNGEISSTTGTVTAVDTASPDWERLIVTGVAPDDAHSAAVVVEWAAANGEIIYFDSALFEASSNADPYFDGASGTGDNPDYVWETSANASRSHYYKNRYAVQTRTSNSTFKDKLPLGTTVAIYLGQPKT